MQLFYLDNIESDICTLSEEESKHCVRVLRLGVGDELHLTDGRGTLCRCQIVDDNPKRCSVEIVERQSDYGKHPFHLHVAIAPTKNAARMEWFVEKAVEMGIDEITPLVCDHSERTVLKTERIEKIAVSAMKQSLKAFKPRVGLDVASSEDLISIANLPSPMTASTSYPLALRQYERRSSTWLYPI